MPTARVRARRRAVARAIAEARDDDLALRDARAAALLDEITTLNHERLGLLSSLSHDKRDMITGFTAAGWDQARSEARHLSLIVRYHRQAAGAWVERVRAGGDAGLPVWETTAVAVALFVLLAAFVWARRRTRELLRWAEARLAAVDRVERRTSPSLGLRAVRLLAKTHRPLEWAVLFACVSWLVPRGARDLLEVELVASALSWAIAGSLVVDLVNALAAQGAGVTTAGESGSGELRLRSLRLVGRTVIIFALTLVLSARLVGEGTIHRWVLSTAWLAAFPVFLVLVRWWRDTVFERLGRLRRRSRVQAWVVANRAGWKSFTAAMVGAVNLFVTGGLKLVRRRLSGSDLARRVHAYLFRRELERFGESRAPLDLAALPGEALAALDPEQPHRRWLPSPADELREALTERAAERRGALVAVVAPRGMGKSSLLRAIADATPRAELVAGHAGMGASELRVAVGEDPSIVLVDDAHTLIEARIGGLARFDGALAFAREHGAETTWVFAVDASMWPLIRRARDERPLFDEIHVLSGWSEEELGALLAERCEAAGIVPHYDLLLDRAPALADELDRQDALAEKRVGYERMLWDHVGGNPGLALEAWRTSLAVDAAGQVHVRPLQGPDLTRLERLPDTSLFVLRAVLQLAPTTVESVAQATRLRPDQVLQDLRFGTAQGYYEDHQGRVRIAWRWLRAVSGLLERRHLVVAS